MTSQTASRTSYFCTACGRHFWTLGGATRHIVAKHDGMADVGVIDDAARALLAKLKGAE